MAPKCPEYAAGNPEHVLPYDRRCPLCNPLPKPSDKFIGLKAYLTSAPK